MKDLFEEFEFYFEKVNRIKFEQKRYQELNDSFPGGESLIDEVWR